MGGPVGNPKDSLTHDYCKFQFSDDQVAGGFAWVELGRNGFLGVDHLSCAMVPSALCQNRKLIANPIG